MVLGMIRHRLHVPLAVLSLVATTVGFFLGHSNPGAPNRSFPHSAHGTLASILVIYLAGQAVLGSYLKLHLKEKRIRPVALFLHGLLGKTFPLVGFVQMVSIKKGKRVGESESIGMDNSEKEEGAMPFSFEL